MQLTTSIKTIGLLTGGGDCPGLNAVIRAVVLSGSYEHGWVMVGFLDGFEGLMDERYINLTPQSVRGILPQGGTILGTSNRGNPFEWRVKDGNEWKIVDRSDKVYQTMKGLGSRCAHCDWRRWNHDGVKAVHGQVRYQRRWRSQDNR